MSEADKTIQELLVENRRLTLRLQEAEETLEAIRKGQIDAVIVSGPQGEEVYTLEGHNRAYRVLFESMNEGAAIIGLDGTVLFCNSMLSKMLRIPMEKILGKSMACFIHEPDAGIFESFLEPDLATDTNKELNLKAEDGTLVPVLVSANPFIIEGPNSICLFMTDLTKRKEAEQELKETLADLVRSNRDLEQFAYVASHDLQEPLRTVASGLQMLQDRNKGKLGEDSDRLIDYTVDAAVRMKALIEDLLAYSRLSTRIRPIETVDMTEILNRSIVNLRSLIAEKGTKVTYDDMPTVKGDSSALSQVFQNLIGNAVKFGPAESPQVHVSARKNGSEWIFSVKDNGIGIQAEHFDRIFVIFQQLSKKGSFHGTGMGLAIVKRIVESHRGRVWVESKVGEGSTFYFTISSGTAA